MAGESANHHIDVWNSSPTGVIFVENESNILVYYRALSKVVFVASSSKLSLVGAWLPLVCPYGFVWTGCRELPALCVNFAVLGYEVQASGYLLKPVNRKTFEATMERVEEQLKAKPPVTHLAKAQSPGTVDSSWHVAFGNPAVTMDRRLIAYALSNAHYVEFTFADGTQTKIRTNFSDVDQRLTVFDNFYRTARGVLVNFDYVSGITNAQFVMKGGKRIPITKTAVTTTCRAYAEYTFTRMRTED